MANNILFVGWNRAVPRREQKALELFARVMEYYTKLQADGKIESFEPVLLSAHGGDLNGFILLRGDAAKLDQVKREETFINLTVEAGYHLENVGHDLYSKSSIDYCDSTENNDPDIQYLPCFN